MKSVLLLSKVLKIITILIFCFILILSYSCMNHKNLSLNNKDKKKTGIISGERQWIKVIGVVNKRLAYIRYAYNRALRDGAKGNGKIVAKFSILSDGKVNDVIIIENSFNFEKLSKECEIEIKKWDFGKFKNLKDTTWVEIPFVMTQ